MQKSWHKLLAISLMLLIGMMLLILSTDMAEGQQPADPGSPEAFAQRGEQFVSEGRFQEALLAYNEAIVRDPANARYYQNRADVYKELGNFDEAIADYSVAIQIRETAIAYFNRAQMYEELNEIDLALQDYASAIRVDPNETVSYYARGLLYERQLQYDNAIADYQQVIAIDANDPFAYWGLGDIYYAREEFDLAYENYQRYIQIVGGIGNAAQSVREKVQTMQAAGIGADLVTPTPQPTTVVVSTPVPPTVVPTLVAPSVNEQSPQEVFLQPSLGGQQQGVPTLTLRHDGLVYGVAPNTDNTKWLSWSADSTARVWNVATGEQDLVLRHNDSVNGASWTRFEAGILTWSDDRTVKIWDAATGDALVSLEHDLPVERAALNSGETRLYATAGADTIYIWDMGDAEVLYRIITDGEILTMDWNPRSNLILLTINPDTTCPRNCAIEMQVLDANTATLILSVPMRNFISAEWSANGQQVFSYVGRDLQVWTTTGGLQPSAAGNPGDLGNAQVVGGSACTVTGESNVTKRSQPSTNAVRVGTLYANQSSDVTGQTRGSDGFIWWRLPDLSWVRSDVVIESGNCTDAVEQVSPSNQ